MVSASHRAAVAQLAQVNVAVMRGPLTSEVMQRFTDAFDPVMRIAEQAPGFVWRLRSASGHATVAEDDGAQLVVNLSLWRDYESLHDFVYRSGHGTFLRRRSQWFLPTPQPSTALWWVPGDERPNVEQALRRLTYLRSYGPSPRAFSLRHQFGRTGAPIRRVGQAAGGRGPA